MCALFVPGAQKQATIKVISDDAAHGHRRFHHQSMVSLTSHLFYILGGSASVVAVIKIWNGLHSSGGISAKEFALSPTDNETSRA